jgi:peroxin-1
MDPVFILYDRQRIMINIDSELKETMIKIKSVDSTSDILKNVPFIILNFRNIDHCEFLHVATQDFKSRPSHCLSLLYGETKMVGYDKPIDCIKEYFKSCIVHEKVYPDNLPLFGVHIYGGIGSGKTSFCRTIAEYMAKFHNFCKILFNLVPVWVDCESLKSNSLSKTKEHLERAMMQASWHAPSLLIFDDLDSLIFNESEMEISLKGKQLAHFFAEQVIERSETQSVYYLVSSIDKTSLHSHLTQSHLFGKTLHLKFPSKKERIEIMKNLLNFEPSNLNMGDICTRMDGYSLADMNFFYESAVKEMTLRHIKKNAPKKLIMDDFENAFESFKPFSISKANVETSKVEWNSVGGLGFLM